MDFDFSDEQRLLKDSVERLIADRYDFETRKRYAQEPEGLSRALGAQYAELGPPRPRARGRGGRGPSLVAAVRRGGAARPAVPGGGRRLRRRGGRNHDRHGGARA